MVGSTFTVNDSVSEQEVNPQRQVVRRHAEGKTCVAAAFLRGAQRTGHQASGGGVFLQPKAAPWCGCKMAASGWRAEQQPPLFAGECRSHRGTEPRRSVHRTGRMHGLPSASTDAAACRWSLAAAGARRATYDPTINRRSSRKRWPMERRSSNKILAYALGSEPHDTR